MASICLKSSIPGPLCIVLAQRRAAAIACGISQTTPVFVAGTSGAVIKDEHGNLFLDLAGGTGCFNSGRRAPAIQAAIEHQAGRFLHTCFMVTP